MKTIQFLDLVRKAAGHSRILLAQGLNAKRDWPLCLTCGRDVQAAELRNINNNSCEVWAKCHGQEDYIKVVFPFRVEADKVGGIDDERATWAFKRALADFCPFDPTVPAK